MARYTLDKLLDIYISQRLQGETPANTIQVLSRLSPDLSEEERLQLSQWIREWELNRGQRRESPPPSPSDTLMRPPLEEADEAYKPPPVPLMPTGLTCRYCGKPNPPDAAYCYACGQPFAADSVETARLDDPEEDPAIFGNLATLVIMIRGYEQDPLHVKLGDAPAVIGRSDAESDSQPEIDLALYGAKEKGVSRVHAIIRRENQTLTLIDQGSVNHTFINGERIHSHEVRALRDGDEIRFARLTTRIAFQRSLRRLGN